MYERPITISGLAHLAGLALLLITQSLPGAASEPVRASRPVRIATVNVNAVLQVLCREDTKRLSAEARTEALALPSETRRDIAMREAAIYAKGYRVLQRTVADYCKAEGIDLVLNDGRPAGKVDSDDVDTVARDIAKHAILTNVDITPQILKRLTTTKAQSATVR